MRCCVRTRLETKPASRSTLRCFDIVGCVTANAPTSSPTLHSERRSRSRIRRLVGSASTTNGSTIVTGLICLDRHMPVKAIAVRRISCGLMSWSMFSFRGHWAHAHDVEQDAFMALASMYVEADPACRDLPWLRDWQAFWLASAG